MSLEELVEDYLFGKSIKLNQEAIDKFFENNEETGFGDDEIEVFCREAWKEFINENLNKEDFNFLDEIETDDIDNIDARSFFKLLKDYTNDRNRDFKIHEIEEERLWNILAIYIAETSEHLYLTFERKFKRELAEKLEKKLEEKTDTETHRLECVICFEKKRIEGFCASCKDKCFCYRCWDKTALENEDCPFCRGSMTVSLILKTNYDFVHSDNNSNTYKINRDRINWINKMRSGILKEIKNRK